MGCLMFACEEVQRINVYPASSSLVSQGGPGAGANCLDVLSLCLVLIMGWGNDAARGSLGLRVSRVGRAVEKCKRGEKRETVCVWGGARWMLGVVSVINVMILIIHLLTASFSHSYD